MKVSSWPIHVFLFSLFPLLILITENLSEIPLYDIITPSIICILITIVVWIILSKFIGIRKSAIIITLLVTIWIIISQVRVIIAEVGNETLLLLGSNKILIPAFLIFTILIIIIILKRRISNDTTSILNIVSIVIFGFLLFQIIDYESANVHDFSSIKEKMRVTTISESDVLVKPNVYFLVLDAYSGDITLKGDYDFDNSKFKNELRDRGFVVQKPSYSNYPNTELAIPSILNMGYLDHIGDEVGIDSENKKIVIELRKQNQVMEIFKKNNYKVVSFSGGLNVDMPNADEQLCGSIIRINSELYESFIYTYLPVAFLRTLFYESYHSYTLECLFSTLKNYQNNDDRPSFIFAHMSLPHPPFIYDADGNHVTDIYTHNRFDSSLKDAYLGQLIFSNKITMEMIDSIQQRDDSAVIMVISDHGGRLGINWYEPTEMDYYRAFNNLSAFHFPDHENEIPEKIAGVNIFRVFFNTYFNTDYEILEDKQMWYVPERPYELTDVTEKLIKE